MIQENANLNDKEKRLLENIRDFLLQEIEYGDEITDDLNGKQIKLLKVLIENFFSESSSLRIMFDIFYMGE